MNNCCVARVLGEFLAAHLALLLEAGEAWDRRADHLEYDLRADVGMMPRANYSALGHGSTSKHVVEADKIATGAACLTCKEVLKGARVNARKRDVRTHAGRDKQTEREQDTIAQTRRS
jgi:hypothetical protein